MLADEIAGSLAANAIFLFALMITVFTGTLNASLRVIDGIILLNLCFSYFFSVLSLFGHRTILYRPVSGSRKIRRHQSTNDLKGFGTYFRLFLAAAVSAYAVWFWTVGIRELGEIHENGADAGQIDNTCPTYLWLFGSWDVLGGIRWFMRVASSISALYFGGLSLVAFVSFCLWFGKTIKQMALGQLERDKAGWGGVRNEWRINKVNTGLSGSSLTMLTRKNTDPREYVHHLPTSTSYHSLPHPPPQKQTD